MSAIGTALSSAVHAGAYTKRKYAIAPAQVGRTTGTVLSGVFIDGSAITRHTPEVALSAIPVLPCKATLASGDSATIQRVIQHRINSSDTWADYGTQPDNVVITAANDGSAVELDLGDPTHAGTLATGAAVTGAKWDPDLSGAKEQIRLRLKVTLTASGTDKVDVMGSVVLAGLGSVPPAGE